MILPIHVYGDPILRLETPPIEGDAEALQRLIDDMLETMHGASGIGLAAPQVGRRERVFVVDLSPMRKELEADGAPLEWLEPLVFVNPEIHAHSDEEEEFEEGCLSIPDVREVVIRPSAIQVRFFDRQFRPRDLEADGMLARVVQHEFDHLNGILFTDRISQLKRRLLRRRLRDMSRGEVEADYPLSLSRPVATRP